MTNTAETQFTPEQKKTIEHEYAFIQYLIKTKQAFAKDKDLYITEPQPRIENGEVVFFQPKVSEMFPELRELLWWKYENEQLLVLEHIILGQMMVENIDQMDKNYYGNLTPVKTALDVVKKKLTQPIEKDFSVVYNNGTKGESGDEASNIIKEFSQLVKSMSNQRVPEKMVMSLMIRAFNAEKDTMLATASRILKKHGLND